MKKFFNSVQTLNLYLSPSFRELGLTFLYKADTKKIFYDPRSLFGQDKFANLLIDRKTNKKKNEKKR